MFHIGYQKLFVNTLCGATWGHNYQSVHGGPVRAEKG